MHGGLGRTMPSARKEIETEGLLVRAVPFGETDVIATFLTESDGKLAAMIRNGRKPSKRLEGVLEPFHTLSLRFDDRGKELCVLREARIVKVRTGLSSDLNALDAAGKSLRWARHLCPPRIKETRAWEIVNALLDELNLFPKGSSNALLAKTGLELLSAVGYELDFSRCTSCGKECPEERNAMFDAALGGLACLNCGGGTRVLSPRLRNVAKSLTRSPEEPLSPPIAADEAGALVAIVEETLAAHANFQN